MKRKAFTFYFSVESFLFRSFCERLPFNFFYFEIEDILYLHECLQPNVNAFLADLFNYFEMAEPQRMFVPYFLGIVRRGAKNRTQSTVTEPTSGARKRK